MNAYFIFMAGIKEIANGINNEENEIAKLKAYSIPQ